MKWHCRAILIVYCLKMSTFLAPVWLCRLNLTSNKEVKPRKEETLQVKLTCTPPCRGLKYRTECNQKLPYHNESPCISCTPELLLKSSLGKYLLMETLQLWRKSVIGEVGDRECMIQPYFLFFFLKFCFGWAEFWIFCSVVSSGLSTFVAGRWEANQVTG